MAGNGLSGLKWLEMAGIDQKMAGNIWKWLKLLEVVLTMMMKMTMMMVNNQIGWPYHSFDCVLFRASKCHGCAVCAKSRNVYTRNKKKSCIFSIFACFLHVFTLFFLLFGVLLSIFLRKFLNVKF